MFGNLRKKIHGYRGSKSLTLRSVFYIKDTVERAVRRLTPRGIRTAAYLRKFAHHQHITDEYNRRLRDAFTPILDTPALPCNPHANVELHTLTGHYHLHMYLLAIKSLLRFHNNVAVIAHDGDGTFTDEDRAVLKKHIPGIYIVEKNVADAKMHELLGPYPHCADYRARIVNSIELLDHLLLSRTKRVITMNSDVLFFREPGELIKWIDREGEKKCLYVYEEKPDKQKEFLESVGCAFPPHVTIALASCYSDILDLPFIEQVLASSRMSKKYPWQMGQCLYPVLFERSSDKYTATHFDKKSFEASGEFKGDAIFRHYWSSTDRFTDLHINDSKRVIAELNNAGEWNRTTV